LTLSEAPLKRFLVILSADTAIDRPRSIRSPAAVPNMPSPAFVRERIGINPMPPKIVQLPQLLSRLVIASKVAAARPAAEVSFTPFAFVRTVRRSAPANE
jgi:hypothetical protein